MGLPLRFLVLAVILQVAACAVTPAQRNAIDGMASAYTALTAEREQAITKVMADERAARAEDRKLGHPDFAVKEGGDCGWNDSCFVPRNRHFRSAFPGPGLREAKVIVSKHRQMLSDIVNGRAPSAPGPEKRPAKFEPPERCEVYERVQPATVGAPPPPARFDLEVAIANTAELIRTMQDDAKPVAAQNSESNLDTFAGILVGAATTAGYGAAAAAVEVLVKDAETAIRAGEKERALNDMVQASCPWMRFVFANVVADAAQMFAYDSRLEMALIRNLAARSARRDADGDKAYEAAEDKIAERAKAGDRIEALMAKWERLQKAHADMVVQFQHDDLSGLLLTANTLFRIGEDAHAAADKTQQAAAKP